MLALGMAGLAGYTDAIGFRAANGYFVSFMSGNTTRLAVDLVAQPSNAWVPAGLIAGFVIGVAAGALVTDLAAARRKTALLSLVCALLIIAATGAAMGSAALLAGTMVLAMGALNNAFRRDGEVAVGVTYMTGAVVRLGQGLAARIGGRETGAARAAGLLWLSLGSGAVAGAMATQALGSAAPALAAVAAGLLALTAARIEARS